MHLRGSLYKSGPMNFGSEIVFPQISTMNCPIIVSNENRLCFSKFVKLIFFQPIFTGPPSSLNFHFFTIGNRTFSEQHNSQNIERRP